jgi:tripartite-type tricarboxylate transporter receptor subunit TctC
MAQIDAVHVPYKGATPALADLVGGHLDFYFGGIAGVLPQAKSGRVRALGVTGSKRSSQLPDIPTIAEAGLPGYEVVTWFGVVAPADAPKDVIGKLNGIITKVVGEPEMKSYLSGQGLEPATSTPEQFAQLIRSEIPKFARIVKAAGIKPE